MAKGMIAAYDRLQPIQRDIDYDRYNRLVIVERFKIESFNPKPRLVKKNK